MSIEAARASDLAGIRRLLSHEQLPDEDVSAQLLERFLVYRNDEEIIGVVGLEPFGDFVLLRSLTVVPGFRDKGIGGLLAAAAEAQAEKAHAKGIYLLTTTAQQYFARRGYRTIPRAEAPLEIQRSSSSRVCVHPPPS